jgi:hypothetical protein
MKLHKAFFLAITLLLLFRGEELYAEQPIACSVPAKSIKAQINDFCFLQFETDDIAHPGVQACVSALSSLPDNCVSRTNLKNYRCYLLQQRELLDNQMTVEKCSNSIKTEGLFVKGCEYPFDEKCVNRVEKR